MAINKSYHMDFKGETEGVRTQPTECSTMAAKLQAYAMVLGKG